EGDVAVIVDVRLELIVVPVIERVSEQEAARATASVIDGHARQRWAHAANFAGLVHVDDAEQRGFALADLAGNRHPGRRPQAEICGEHVEPRPVRRKRRRYAAVALAPLVATGRP